MFGERLRCCKVVRSSVPPRPPIYSHLIRAKENLEDMVYSLVKIPILDEGNCVLFYYV
jgi:hypothetical protein